MKAGNSALKTAERESAFASLRKTKTWVFIAVFLFFLILPRFGIQYISYLMLTFFGYAVALLGFNLLFGYTGLLSFGHALFFAIGAYTVAFLTSKFSIFPIGVHLLVAISVSAFLLP